MRIIYKETINQELSNAALNIINNISKKAHRHQLKEYFNNTIDVYYNDEDHIMYMIKTKETDEGICVEISKTFV